MTSILNRLTRDDLGSHVLEYALLAIGIIAAVFQPSVFIAAYYRLADLIHLFRSQVGSVL